MRHAPWPGHTRKPAPPPPERDELMAECIRSVATEFGCFAAALVGLLALVALAGCQSVTITRGDETVSARSFLTKLNLATSCAEYDASGNLLSQTSQNFNSEGDAQALAAAGSFVGTVLGGVAKLVPVPGVPGIRQGAIAAPPRAPAVTACNGERTIPMLEAKEP